MSRIISKDYEQYWKNVWKNKVEFLATTKTKSLPWDIKTHDTNLKECLDYLNLSKGNLLEIGCGSGFDANYLANRGFNVTALDISDEAIEKAKNLNKGLSIDFIATDFFTFDSIKKYDIVYDRGFLHSYVNFLDSDLNLNIIFEKIYNLLNSNGYFILISGNANAWQEPPKTCLPPPVFISDVEKNCFKWFQIVLVQEIVFKLEEKYNDSIGYIFLLKKRNSICNGLAS